jgi:hypothetical protein
VLLDSFEHSVKPVYIVYMSRAIAGTRPIRYCLDSGSQPWCCYTFVCREFLQVCRQIIPILKYEHLALVYTKL